MSNQPLSNQAMDIRIQPISPIELESVHADLVNVYEQAYREPPYSKQMDEVERFSRDVPGLARDPGFRLILARETRQGAVVGFAIGRTIVQSREWFEIVSQPIKAAGLGEWLIGGYQLAELAVIPQRQRHGIGGRLHDQLLQGITHEKAVLTTMAAETAAYRFYLSRGWQLLLDEIQVPYYLRNYRVMGLRLR